MMPGRHLMSAMLCSLLSVVWLTSGLSLANEALTVKPDPVPAPAPPPAAGVEDTSPHDDDPPPSNNSDDGVDLQAIASYAAKRAERVAIEQALDRFRWNRRKAAEYLKVSYKTLLNKMKECGISDADAN